MTADPGGDPAARQHARARRLAIGGRVARAVVGTLLAAAVVTGAVGVIRYDETYGGSDGGTQPVGSATGNGVGRYVALGDNITAAPGTGRPVGSPEGCLRSANNYPAMLAGMLRPRSFADVSCTGAGTMNLTVPQSTPTGTNPAQLDAVTPDTTLVTVGIGINDIHLLEMSMDCVSPSPISTKCWEAHSVDSKTDDVTSKIDGSAPGLVDALNEIRERAPRAQILLVGYPTQMPDDETCFPELPFGPHDVKFLAQTLSRLNGMLGGAAKENESGFVDTQRPSKGHDVCKPPGTRWVEGVRPHPPIPPLHPNELGSRAMADAIYRLVRR